MLQAENLSIAYAGEPVLENISFTLQKGERCGLIGRNGSGKTTLLRLIMGKESADSGRIIIPKGYTLGYLDQHIRFTQPTILEEAALGLKESEQSHLYKAEMILFGLGFKKEDMEKSPGAFSGGYHLRLHLAKVLVAEPDCLLLDEPTNYLDILSIRWLEQFLRVWKGEFILITHDREFMDAVTTHTMGIHHKKMRKVEGNTVKFFEQLFAEEEIHERTRLNLQKKQEHLQSFIDRFGAKATKAAQAQSKQKMLDRIPVLEKLKELYSLQFSFNEHPFSAKKMVEAKSLDFAYVESSPLIKNFSLEIEKGERIAIIGKNGIGKSTLLRLLARDLLPGSGEVKYADNIRLGYFGQTNIDRLNPKHTIEQEISLANPTLTTTEVRKVCGLMMFGQDRSEKPISVLSGGERSRVLLGKILTEPCNLLFLDEPTHHLDMESIEALIDALEDFSGSIVIVTHSELILRRLKLDKIIHCSPGKQDIFCGDYDEFLEKIGWGEGVAIATKTEISSNLQKERGGLITHYHSQMKILDAEIKKCEKAIIKLEELQKKEQDTLVKLFQEGKSASPDLVESVAKRQKEIKALFEKLEELYNEYHKVKEAFEEERVKSSLS